MADYITNPSCPLFNSNNDATTTILSHQTPTIVELGSGVGLASLAAALLGCRVFATDGSPSSTRLLQENFDRYRSDCAFTPQASLLEWGDDASVDSLIYNLGKLPDIVIASDVVYAHSAREELSQTIRKLCPPGHMNGRVVIAHRWRADPTDEERFFQSFNGDFDRQEIGIEFFPEDEYYRTKSMIDFRYPMSIFEMKRKW